MLPSLNGSTKSRWINTRAKAAKDASSSTQAISVETRRDGECVLSNAGMAPEFCSCSVGFRYVEGKSASTSADSGVSRWTRWRKTILNTGMDAEEGLRGGREAAGYSSHEPGMISGAFEPLG